MKIVNNGGHGICNFYEGTGIKFFLQYNIQLNSSAIASPNFVSSKLSHRPIIRTWQGPPKGQNNRTCQKISVFILHMAPQKKS